MDAVIHEPIAATRTFILCDWNIIQSIGGKADLPLPLCYEWVVPDQAFHEVANKADCEQRKSVSALRGWLSRHADRLWVGHASEALFERQHQSDGQSLTLDDLIDHEDTGELRARVKQESYDWQSLFAVAAESTPVRNRNAHIAQYVQFCKVVTAGWRQSGKVPIPESAQVQQIQLAGLVTGWIEQYFGKWWRDCWSPIAAKQANQFALERWARLVVWYCLKLADNHTNKFENNFDDIHYALLASYVGQLATNDKGLQPATRAIFPDVVIKTESDLKNG